MRKQLNLILTEIKDEVVKENFRKLMNYLEVQDKHIIIPSKTTEDLPENAPNGTIYHNSTTGVLNRFNGESWEAL